MWLSLALLSYINLYLENWMLYHTLKPRTNMVLKPFVTTYGLHNALFYVGYIICKQWTHMSSGLKGKISGSGLEGKNTQISEWNKNNWFLTLFKKTTKKQRDGSTSSHHKSGPNDPENRQRKCEHTSPLLLKQWIRGAPDQPLSLDL